MISVATWTLCGTPALASLTVSVDVRSSEFETERLYHTFMWFRDPDVDLLEWYAPDGTRAGKMDRNFGESGPVTTDSFEEFQAATAGQWTLRATNAGAESVYHFAPNLTGKTESDYGFLRVTSPADGSTVSTTRRPTLEWDVMQPFNRSLHTEVFVADLDRFYEEHASDYVWDAAERWTAPNDLGNGLWTFRISYQQNIPDTIPFSLTHVAGPDLGYGSTAEARYYYGFDGGTTFSVVPEPAIVGWIALLPLLAARRRRAFVN